MTATTNNIPELSKGQHIIAWKEHLEESRGENVNISTLMFRGRLGNLLASCEDFALLFPLAVKNFSMALGLGEKFSIYVADKE